MTIEQIGQVEGAEDMDAALDIEIDAELAAAHKPKKIKHCSKFYFFCPTLNAKVHGDTCAINKA